MMSKQVLKFKYVIVAFVVFHQKKEEKIDREVESFEERWSLL